MGWHLTERGRWVFIYAPGFIALETFLATTGWLLFGADIFQP